MNDDNEVAFFLLTPEQYRVAYGNAAKANIVHHSAVLTKGELRAMSWEYIPDTCPTLLKITEQVSNGS